MFPWGFAPKQAPQTPRDLMLERLRFGVPVELVTRAAGVDWETIKDDPEIIKAVAEGEILLFERARDGGVTGSIRAALRNETKSWVPKAEAIAPGGSLEDLLRE